MVNACRDTLKTIREWLFLHVFIIIIDERHNIFKIHVPMWDLDEKRERVRVREREREREVRERIRVRESVRERESETERDRQSERE